MKKLVVMLVGVALLFISGASARAQAPVPPPGAVGPSLAPAQLDQLVGPIALYPDPLIAEILPAATIPSEIVVADRYVSEGGDPNQIAAQGWDPSVQALAHYPNVLKWMDDNLAWTTQLGQAFASQQADVMDAVQRLRGQAQQLGNLPSTPQESVTTDSGDIEIQPTNPDEMFVPSYQADVIFYEPGIYCTFPFWLPLGIWLGHDCDWHHHGLIFWGPDHPRPGNWWHESPGRRHSYITGHSLPKWHAGAGLAAGGRGGWDRGYETTPANRSFARPAAPREMAPKVITVRPAPIARQPVIAPTARPEFRSAPSEGVFGGQSRNEAIISSSRGQASRASTGGGFAPSAPARGGGGGGGGGASHGGGSGGGGGQHR